jgi:hypothetical protein
VRRRERRRVRRRERRERRVRAAARASGERKRRVPMQKMQGSDGRVLRRKTRSTAG